MKLTLDRKWKKEGYTVGNLYIDGIYFCNTMEDKDRGLKKTWPLSQIKHVKVPNECRGVSQAPWRSLSAGPSCCL